jgi:hypothetical protein
MLEIKIKQKLLKINNINQQYFKYSFCNNGEGIFHKMRKIIKNKKYILNYCASSETFCVILTDIL